MIRLLRAWAAVFAAELEKFAAEMSENAKAYPKREFYRGYEQGMKDAQQWPEYGRNYLDSKAPRQDYPNE